MTNALQELSVGDKYTTAQGNEATIEAIAGDSARVVIRLAPRRLIRKVMRLADIRAALVK